MAGRNQFEEVCSKESKDSKDEAKDHPFAVNQSRERKESDCMSRSWKSSTAKLGHHFSLSAKSDEHKIEDNRVCVPTFALITDEPVKKPIQVVLYGNDDFGNQNLFCDNDSQKSNKTNSAMIEIQEIKYKIYFSKDEKVHPAIILYFPTLRLPLADLSLIEHRFLFKIEYEDLEDAEAAKMSIKPCRSFVSEPKLIKCDPKVADKVLTNLLVNLRNDYLLTHQGIQLTSEAKSTQSNCCS